MHPDLCETCHSELRGDGTCPMCDPSATPRPAGPDLTTPLADDERLLVCGPSGTVVCRDVNTARVFGAYPEEFRIERVRLVAPSSPGAPEGDAPVTDPRDMDAAPPAGTGGERE